MTIFLATISHLQGFCADNLSRKPFHFFELGTELEQDEVAPGFFELVETLRNLFGSANQARAETTVRDGVVFEGDSLFELGASKPLLVVGVAGGGLLYVGDAADFVLRFFFGFPDDGVSGNALFQWNGIVLRPALTKIGHFFSDTFGRVAVH